MGRPQPLGHLEPVHLWEHHIQNNQVVLARQAVVHAVRPVIYGVHLIALVLQQLPQGLCQTRLVLYN